MRSDRKSGAKKERKGAVRMSYSLKYAVAIKRTISAIGIIVIRLPPYALRDQRA
jgi:hypothetical protein